MAYILIPMLRKAECVAVCGRQACTLRGVRGLQVSKGQLLLNASKDVKLRCKQVHHVCEAVACDRSESKYDQDQACTNIDLYFL